MNEVFVVSNWNGTNVCAYQTYDAAKKYILEEILDHYLDFEYEFESEQDACREYYDTDEDYENAFKNYITEGVMTYNRFFDEFSIDSVPFMNE